MKGLLFAMLVLLIFSCTKEKEPCAENNLGELCVTNLYTHSAKGLVNGVQIGLVAANGELCSEVAAETMVVTVIDEINAAYKSGVVEIFQCDTRSISLP